MSSRDQGTLSGCAGPKIFVLVCWEFILFCKNNWKLDFFLEDLKAFRARGFCSGSALNFWAPGRSSWNAARGLALAAFTGIVAKIAICIIRILLNFCCLYNGNLYLRGLLNRECRGYRGGDGHKSYSPPFLYCNFHLRYLSFRIKIYTSAALYTVWPHRPEISDNPDTPETKVVNKKVSLIKRETFTIFFIHSLFLRAVPASPGGGHHIS